MSQIQPSEMQEARLARLYLVLCERAKEGALCPTSAEVAAHLNMSAKSNIGRYFTILERRGLIRSELYMRGRVVTISDTGDKTAPIPDAGQLQDGAQLPGRTKDNPEYWNSPERIAQRQSDREARAERIAELIPVDRSPCPFCGVRGDIGCKHRKHP